MALDPYAPCPCGSGKKIKFCDCSKDMVGDLERVLTLLDAEQRVAGLDQINKLIASKGERAALLALKASTLLESGDTEQAESSVATFLEKFPDNPLALAQSAIIDVAHDNLNSGVNKLQRSLAQVGQEIPHMVYEAIGLLGQSLLAAGNILGARGHLMLQASIGGAEDTRALQLLMRLQASPQVPLLLKQDLQVSKRPENVSWAKEFDEAQELAHRGGWLAAAQRLARLAERFPKETSLPQNSAIYRSYVGDTPETVRAWRCYANHPQTPLDDAVEAEALAQLIDENAPDPETDLVSLEYPVEDAQVVMERLISDKRVAVSPTDPAEMVEEGEPPPKGVYWLLDRPVPETGVGIAKDAVPKVVGELMLFGKQTDRAARLEFVAARTDDFPAKTKALSQLLFGLIGAAAEEEVVDKVPSTQLALTWNWRFPNDTPLEHRQQLVEEQRRDMLLNVWPTVPSAVLDGKRPAEAASNPSYRIRILAMILRLESGSPQELRSINLNDLRSKLGLPTRDPLDPARVDVERLPVVRFPLLVVEKLSDDQLVTVYRRAIRTTSPRIMLPLVNEVVRRPQLGEKVNLSEAHSILANLTPDNAQAFAYAAKARELAVAKGQSAAPWMLEELSLRLSRLDLEGSQQLLRQIQVRYQRDANVMRALTQMLIQYGILSPDGTPAGPPRPAAGVPSPVAAAAPAPPASKLWTPESAAAPAAGEGKSKLWLPGME